MKGIDIKADKNRTLRFTINSMIQFKRERKQNFTQALTSLADNFDMELLRYLYYLGLRWEDPELTEEKAGDIMDIIISEQGMEGLALNISDAINVALGQQNETPDPNVKSH